MIARSFWRQVYFLTRASLKARYRNTLGGFLWVVINPLAMYGVQSLVFKTFLKLEIPNYYLFLLAGLLPWIFISMSLRMSVPIFEERRSLLKSFKLSPLVLIYTQIFDNLINFVLPFTFLILALLIFGGGVTWQALAFSPLAMLTLVFGIFPLCWILSVLQIFYKDVRFIVEFVLSFLFFLTPIFYPRDYIPPEFQFIVDFNLIYILIEPFFYSLYHFELMAFLWSLLKAFLAGSLLYGVAVFLWRRKRNEFYLQL